MAIDWQILPYTVIVPPDVVAPRTYMEIIEDMKETITLKKFAEMAGKHPDTIIRWLKKPDCQIKSNMRNGQYDFYLEDVERFLGLTDEFPVDETHCPIIYELERTREEAEYLYDALDATTRQCKAADDIEARRRIAGSFTTNLSPKYQQFLKRREANLQAAIDESWQEAV